MDQRHPLINHSLAVDLYESGADPGRKVWNQPCISPKYPTLRRVVKFYKDSISVGNEPRIKRGLRRYLTLEIVRSGGVPRCRREPRRGNRALSPFFGGHGSLHVVGSWPSLWNPMTGAAYQRACHRPKPPIRIAAVEAGDEDCLPKLLVIWCPPA
jgi:hypothetical protein